MSSGDFLRVQIDQREGYIWDENMLEMYATGLMGIFPAEDGDYTDEHGKSITLEMHAEKLMSGLWVIAVTSDLFVGHERSVGGRGESRRTVHMNKDKSRGSADLDSYRILRLKVLTGN